MVNFHFKKTFSIVLILAMLLSVLPNNNSLANAEPYQGFKELGSVESYELDNYNLYLTITTGEKIRIQFYKDNLIRIYMDPEGEFQEAPSPNNSRHTTKPLVKNLEDYIGDNLAVKPLIEDSDLLLTVKTGNSSLIIDKKTSKMKLMNKDKVIWEEAKPLNYKDGETIQTLVNHDKEYFYGGGVQNGRFSHRGEIINIVNENNWTDGGVASPAPFYWSTRGYGVIRNTFKPGKYDFGNSEKSSIKTSHKEDKMDAIYFVADSPQKILDEYTQISGRPVFMPEASWYPYHLNAYNRDTWVKADENTHGARKFEDGNYYKEYQPGQLGNRVGTLETLNGPGLFTAETMLKRYENHDMPLGVFLPNDGYGAGYGQTDSLDGDIENLRIFTEFANKRGVETGLWTQQDMHPKDPANPKKGERDVKKEVNIAGIRNIKTDVAWVGYGYDFGLDGIRDIADILINDVNQRPNIITVDGWVGTQRYASVWTGDQYGGQWEYIRFHIPTYIGAGLSGIANITSDMDGIFGGSPLIMTRDTEWKAFTPQNLYMDGWGEYQKNPWEHGEPYASINRMYLKLKSSLLPYNYSLAKKAADTGLPMVRPMFLDYPSDYTYGTATKYQYMWGDSFLIAPIYQDTKMDKSTYADIRNDIYLPEGNTWIDYFSGKQYEGGQILNGFEAPLWKLPVFVKSGSIIPMYKPNNNPKDVDRSFRIYEIYPDKSSNFDQYEDQGSNMNYTKGQSATTRISSNLNGETLDVKVDKTQGNYENIVLNRASEFRIHASKKPSGINAEVSGSKYELKEYTNLEDYEKAESGYFYDELGKFEKFASEGSDFENVEINRGPIIRIKIGKVNVRENSIDLKIEGFSNKEIQEVTDQNLPEVPSNFTSKTIKDKFITLQWDKSEGAKTYEIEFEGNIYSNIDSESFTFSDLTPDTNYSFRIRARNTKGVSAWSDEINLKTELDPLRNAIHVKEAHNSATDQAGTPFSNMFDHDEKSMWHTEWFKSQTPMTSIIDLRAIYQLDKLIYLARPDNGNGTITKYSFDYSLDGRTWINGEESTWERQDANKTFDFGDHRARFLRLNIKEAVGGFGSGYEFYIFKDDGTDGRILGDTNSNKKVDANDLTFFLNYAGLRDVDSDWPGYVESFDYNSNKIIDAYDINLVQTLRANRKYEDIEKISGKLSLKWEEKSLKKGDTINLFVSGKDLNDLNAFSLEFPFDSKEFKLISIEAMNKTSSMTSFSKERTHSDGSQNIFVAFGNEGKNPVNGNQLLAKVELQALVDIDNLKFDPNHTMLVDTNLYYTEAKEGQEEKPTINKISHRDISVSGDESAYQEDYSPLSAVNDGDRSTLAELKWDWEDNWDENGNLPENVKLPQEITMELKERTKKLNKITIVKRAGGNGSVKTVKVDVYDGDKIVFTKELVLAKNDSALDIETNNLAATKAVVTVKDTYDPEGSKPMMSLAEIEMYEYKDAPSKTKIDKTDLEIALVNSKKIRPKQ